MHPTLSLIVPLSYLYWPGEIQVTQKIRVCPRCGSAKISEAKSSVGGWLVPSSYCCQECDYVGQVFVEIEISDLKKLQQAIKGEA